MSPMTAAKKSNKKSIIPWTNIKININVNSNNKNYNYEAQRKGQK